MFRESIIWRNAAGDGDINCIKVNASDVPELLVGAVLSADTAPASDAAIANKKYVDDQIAAELLASIQFSAYCSDDSESNAMLKAHAYKAATAGFVTAYISLTTGQTLKGYVGDTNDPEGAGWLVQSLSAPGNATYAITMYVGKDEYFEVTTTSSGAVTMRWKSVGTLSKPIDQD